jgi:hypothetical protein
MSQSDRTLSNILGQITIWVKSKIPVSRGRYNRELALLKLSVNRSIAEEKSQLDLMIQRLSWSEVFPRDGARELRVSFRVTDDLIYMQRSPAMRDRLFMAVGENIAEHLKRDVNGCAPSFNLSKSA